MSGEIKDIAMPYETILTDVADAICTITINRLDKLNALNTAMIRELIDAFDQADADDGVRAIIVTGAGRAFCAGADLSMGGGTFDRDMRKDRPPVPIGPDGKPDLAHDNARDGGGRITLRIFNCRKPVIAAVNGPAVGIGATMLLPMDVRIASSEARFGFVFSQRGIVPEAASSYFLPRIVGISQALAWCYSGRVFGAEEALAERLVSRVVPPDELMTTARSLAHSFIDNAAPVSVALIRQMMWRMLGAGHPMDAHRLDSRAMFDRGRSADVKEGIASFLEKRPPHFTDTVSGQMPVLPWGDEPEYR
jgi:enoyl-CoA hydratase/carnithine racemase